MINGSVVVIRKVGQDGAGLGKRDEEEYARNQRDYVPRKVNRIEVRLR
jgi:hypothetical protein